MRFCCICFILKLYLFVAFVCCICLLHFVTFVCLLRGELNSQLRKKVFTSWTAAQETFSGVELCELHLSCTAMRILMWRAAVWENNSWEECFSYFEKSPGEKCVFFNCVGAYCCQHLPVNLHLNFGRKLFEVEFNVYSLPMRGRIFWGTS